MTAATSEAAIWHEVECGSYGADLALWEELAAGAAGPVLELGCGSGRVALHLARQGFTVSALDRSPELLAELRRRAGKQGLALETIEADARDFSLPGDFSLICAPMQLAHLLGGAGGREAMLRAAAAHLRPGGTVALALLAELAAPPSDLPPPLPDVIERDGCGYSSQPIEVRAVEGGLEVRRLRQRVSPRGELSDDLDVVRLDQLDPETLEAEAAAAGLRASGRLEVAATDEHVGSVVCLLEGKR